LNEGSERADLGFGHYQLECYLSVSACGGLARSLSPAVSVYTRRYMTDLYAAERSLWTFASCIASAYRAALIALSYAALKLVIVVGLVGIRSCYGFLGTLFLCLAAVQGSTMLFACSRSG
jgi:hypothetical protein